MVNDIAENEFVLFGHRVLSCDAKLQVRSAKTGVYLDYASIKDQADAYHVENLLRIAKPDTMRLVWESVIYARRTGSTISLGPGSLVVEQKPQ